jgi:hypothetical protein
VFSKFHLNTSNAPNIKVVQFIAGHNFHVERHLRFEEEMGEKPWSIQFSTIHRRHKNFQVGMPFVHNSLRKNLYDLCRSCRGLFDLQLSYLSLGPLQLRNFEKNSVEER